MIREILLGCGAVYLLITLVQVIERPSIQVQAVFVGLFLAISTGFYWATNKKNLKIWEEIALWGAIILFVLYGALTFGGII